MLIDFIFNLRALINQHSKTDKLFLGHNANFEQKMKTHGAFKRYTKLRKIYFDKNTFAVHYLKLLSLLIFKNYGTTLSTNVHYLVNRALSILSVLSNI